MKGSILLRQHYDKSSRSLSVKLFVAACLLATFWHLKGSIYNRLSQYAVWFIDWKDSYYIAKTEPSRNSCFHPACIHASSEILHNLSPEYKTLDPCTDFEEMTCSGWKDRYDIPADQGEYSYINIMTERVHMLLRHI